MAKRDDASNAPTASFAKAKGRSHPVQALVFVVLALLLMLAFVGFTPEQNFINTSNPRDTNPVGKIGVLLSWYSFLVLGWSAWLLPLFSGYTGYLLVSRSARFTPLRAFCMLFCVLASSVILVMMASGMQYPEYYAQGPGGIVGTVLFSDFFEGLLGYWGTLLVLAPLYFLAFFVLFTNDIREDLDEALDALRRWRDERREQRQLLAAARQAEEEARKLEPLPAEAAAPATEEPADPPPAKENPPVRGEAELSEDERALAQTEARKAVRRAQGKPEEAEAEEDAASAGKGRKTLPPATMEEVFGSGKKKGHLRIVAAEEPKKAAQPSTPEKQGDYIFPPLSLLKEPARGAPQTDEAEHTNNAMVLVRTLREFGVLVDIGEIHTGPVITRYEVSPKPGVRVEKIASLDKNIAMAMRAQSVRILAPVPGKGCVGVEVPNARPTPVGIREILESEEWGGDAALPIALGREVTGKPVVSDLARMPHLLIAGATGSGKSVCINSIIASFVYRYGPEDLRLIMVDPKIVELSIYNDLPHMLIPVVTEPKRVPGALKWLIGEMENRYQLFSRHGVRNIAGYNQRRRRAPAPAEDKADNLELPLPAEASAAAPDPVKLPYIVCVMDEIADLMLVAPQEIESSIARLAQLARAAGIHLILATQRPSVNVITGVIKANLPCRIAFQVASSIDSRTILDTKGAEQLIGRGDMLFSPPGSGRLLRSQGCFISDDEIREVVEHLKQNGSPVYADHVAAEIERAMQEEDDGAEEEEGDADHDEMLPQAVEVLRSSGRASTSMLQRRLRIGYNRAARLMEILERRGVVGPENGSSPREILRDLNNLDL